MPLRLRTGLHVVRRDDRHLQVGLDPPWRLVVADLPEVHELLGDLADGRTPRTRSTAAQRVLRDLHAAGMLTSDDPVSRPPVALLGPEQLVSAAAALLREAAVPVLGPRSDMAEAAAVLVLADGEPARSLIDEQMRAGRAHLVVAGEPTGLRVGPFVRPGDTACQRCVDAHHGDLDPRRAVVVEQLAGLRLAPADPALMSLATAWAVSDLVTYLDGHLPTTWSASVSLAAGCEPRYTSWTRHPHCGCAWADGLVS